jgi:hypothetical protein
VGPIGGLGRILDGKVESDLMSDSELRGGSLHRVGQSLTSPAVMYTEIVYGPLTDRPVCGIVSKTYTRVRCGPARVIDHCCELWPLIVPLLLTCAMWLGYFPCKDVN